MSFTVTRPQPSTAALACGGTGGFILAVLPIKLQQFADYFWPLLQSMKKTVHLKTIATSIIVINSRITFMV